MTRFAMIFATALLLVATTAHAQEPSIQFGPMTAGNLRVGLDMPFMGFTVGDYDGFYMGIDEGREGLTPLPGLVVGYTVMDNLFVGGRLKLNFTSIENSDIFTWQILPYVEYSFLDGPVRPFVAGNIGVGGTAGDEDLVQFVIGAGGGAHFFVADMLSIDALLLFNGLIGKQTFSVAGVGDVDADMNVFSMDILVGLSGWFAI